MEFDFPGVAGASQTVMDRIICNALDAVGIEYLWCGYLLELMLRPISIKRRRLSCSTNLLFRLLDDHNQPSSSSTAYYGSARDTSIRNGHASNLTPPFVRVIEGLAYFLGVNVPDADSLIIAW